MARLNICHAPTPLPQYRIDSPLSRDPAKARYDSMTYAWAEDRKRVAAIARTAERAKDPENRDRALTLARKLDYRSRGDDPPNSLASYGFIVQERIRIIGDVWRLADAYIAAHGPNSVRTVTIMRKDWELPVATLTHERPLRWLEQLCADLKRCEFYKESGGMIAGLHGNYEPMTNYVRPHIHAVVFGSAAHAINKLRKLKAYRPIVREHEGVVKRTPSIRMSDRPLTNLPEPLTYILQGFWPSHWEGIVDGEWKRQGEKARIQGSAHTRVLLWLDRFKVEEITLLMGMRMSKSGLVLTH